MLFNIEADRGNQIVGYLVPDNYSETPTIRVGDGRRSIAMVTCSEERPALVASGRHATGRCGFSIDESIIPNLAASETIELYDASTGILIYRRRPQLEVTRQRIFRLETHLFPLWTLDEAVEQRFQFFHKGIERHGRETATQVFLLTNAQSMYASGRLAFKAYEGYVHNSFKCVVLMHDPYFELSERILTLKHVRSFGDELLGARDMMTFEAAIEFALGLETDEHSLHKAFAEMPKAAIAAFSNPLTRILTVESFDDAPRKDAISKALDALSTFAIVGLREREDVFLEDMESLLGAPPGTLPPIPFFGSVGHLARKLKRIPEVELLLEQDIEIYHTVKAAIEQTL